NDTGGGGSRYDAAGPGNGAGGASANGADNGGGGGGGGGGGSDYCQDTTVSGTTVSGCAVTAGAGTSTTPGVTRGEPQVVVSYATGIGQASPTSGATSTVGSSSFTDQLAASPGTYVGSVTFSQQTGAPDLVVSPTGAVSTAGPLPAGQYTATGSDSDPSGGAGVWTYTLTVSAVPIEQAAPTASVTTTGASSSFTDQLQAVAGSYVGAVSYSESTGSSDVVVSSTGAVTAPGPLARGTYTATGTDSDSSGDTGTWTYTLTVKVGRPIVSSVSPASGPVTGGTRSPSRVSTSIGVTPS
ncbi:MAG: hypothetical protein ACYC0E_12240, partial [Acidimicrobiales bacterium]